MIPIPLTKVSAEYRWGISAGVTRKDDLDDEHDFWKKLAGLHGIMIKFEKEFGRNPLLNPDDVLEVKALTLAALARKHAKRYLISINDDYEAYPPFRCQRYYQST